MRNASDFLAAIMRDDERDGSTILPEAQVMTLKEIAARYSERPFSVGDLVTPRTGYNLKGAGAPHIVVEVLPSGEFLSPPNASGGSPSFGARYSMRIVCLDSNEYVAFWVEPWTFEPYSA